MTAYPYIVGFIGGYIVLYVLLLVFPTLLHKKKNVFLARHGSHRGGGAERPENTLAAFHHAVAVGSQCLELDVHLTRDNHLVVAHDHNTTRLSDEIFHIAETDYSGLPPVRRDLQIDPTFSPHADPGALAYEDERDTDTLLHMPLLREVFDHFPNTPINIDVKAPSEAAIAHTHELITSYQRQSITVWGSFSKETCDRMYKLDPSIPLLFSAKAMLFLYLKFMLGILPFCPIRESFLEIPLTNDTMRSRVNRRFASNGGCLKRIALALAEWLTQNKTLHFHLRRRGIRVIYWVVNTEEDFALAFKNGADGVFTDYPTMLANWLRDRNMLDSAPRAAGKAGQFEPLVAASNTL